MKKGDTLKRIASKKIHIFKMLQPASSMGASFHMRMFGISPGDFVSTMTAVCTAMAMKKFGVIPWTGLNPAKEGLIR